MSIRKRRAARERRERRTEAVAALSALYAELHEAYARFDRTADPALAEACIFQIGALRARCGAAARALKALDAEEQGGIAHAASDTDRARRRRRAAGSAAEASEKAHQAGV